MQHPRWKDGALEMASASKYFQWYAAMKSSCRNIHGTFCPVPVSMMQDAKQDLKQSPGILNACAFFPHVSVLVAFKKNKKTNFQYASVWDDTT